MSYIPKSAQRKIDKYKQMAARADHLPAPLPAGPVEPPKRLRSGQPGAGMWDVYFNGERQHLCTFADVQLGRITRFKHGRGSIGVGKDTENLIGHVEIVRKGDPSKFVAVVDEIKEFVKENPMPVVRGTPSIRLPSQRVGRGFRRNPGVILAATAALLAAGVKVDHGED